MKPPFFARRLAGSRRLLLGLIGSPVLLLGLTSCEDVKFYEKQKLASPLMQFESSTTFEAFRSKTLYSREGSVGGIGATAGGGCGCH